MQLNSQDSHLIVRPNILRTTVVALLAMWLCPAVSRAQTEKAARPAILDWSSVADLPDALGVAGPVAGVHNDRLLVAGGANFARPVWDNDKQWKSAVYLLDLQKENAEWTTAGELNGPIAYGACLSTELGVFCIGGSDGTRVLDTVFLVVVDQQEDLIRIVDYPPLPTACAYSQAAQIGDYIYVCGGQSGDSLDTAMDQLWRMRLTAENDVVAAEWEILSDCPGGPRAFNVVCAQHNGYEDCLYVMSGRRESSIGSDSDGPEFLTDVWEFSPKKMAWRQRSDAPRCVMAAAAAPLGQSHIVVLGGADGSLFDQVDALRDEHPGFPKEALLYHAITDRWTSAGTMPANQVTTTAIAYDGGLILPSGEVRPRVRTSKVWRIKASGSDHSFGWLNYTVLTVYLAAMLGIGVYFASRTHTTNDFFRGGNRIPWWAAGCSIFATMLSSLTFTGIPSKAYAQDWVYAIGNFMIPIVAFVGVFVALPFYRKIDATSAYEYLEKRFSRPVRWFGSLSFSFFHVFRIAVVLSLTGLALAVATPLTPAQAVLLMGTLSIAYSALGGIEAVIWTDTIQAVVLLGGAALAIVLLISGTTGGWVGVVESSSAADKLRMANFHFDPTNAQLALWVVVFGALGQNLSSYTADQAVVQRYMTTRDQRTAAQSIWTNAVLTIPATLLFFGIGTCLFAYYQSHPERLDPTATTDQVFPLFIAREMPAGIAGVIVAGIFSAAQSTVSTSMNSTATTLVTDFLRPLRLLKSERRYLQAARVFTVTIGTAGTLLGLVFIDPSIKSLFDAFIRVIGLFMGVLGGLFVLGATTRRANAPGALIGSLTGVGVMLYIWQFSQINGYLYPAIGIATCFVVGYVTSFLFRQPLDIQGLTIHG